MPGHSEHSQDEHPLNHTFQILAIVCFVLLWISDSFFFHFSSFLSWYIPWFIPIPVGVVVLFLGVYFANSAHHTVFDPNQEGVIDSGVYGRVRHPMYLGVLLVLLGIILTTLSLITLLLWLIVFIGYNHMASYEERVLIQRFGDDYREYQRRVSKWLPI